MRACVHECVCVCVCVCACVCVCVKYFPRRCRPQSQCLLATQPFVSLNCLLYCGTCETRSPCCLLLKFICRRIFINKTLQLFGRVMPIQLLTYFHTVGLYDGRHNLFCSFFFSFLLFFPAMLLASACANCNARARLCVYVSACRSLHCKNEIVTLTFIHG